MNVKVYFAVRKALCTGVALILFSNIVYILDNYTVSWFQLHSTEVTLVRGIVQVLGFGFVILIKNRKQKNAGFLFCCKYFATFRSV